MPLPRFLSCLLGIVVGACAAGADPECEWCGAPEAPPGVTHTVRIADTGEPGERLHFGGTVYASDRSTPAPGVLVYLYHTNAKGRYPRRGDETGNGRRHGYLRGWVVTDARGRYDVDTIRPGAYPFRKDPAHIHISVKPPGRAEYGVDTVHFVGDPRLTQRELSGAGLVELVRQADGSWAGRHDIVLRDDDRALP